MEGGAGDPPPLLGGCLQSGGGGKQARIGRVRLTQFGFVSTAGTMSFIEIAHVPYAAPSKGP